MGKVLYEAHFQFDPAMLVPIIMLVWLALFPKIHGKLSLFFGNERAVTNERFVRIFCIIGCIFIVMITMIFLPFQIHMHMKTVGAYKSGQYKVVEGYVEQFDPIPYEGHAHESFEIDGVYFEYSDYNIAPGYRNAKSHGGIITGDGQYLKIGYVYYNSTYGNIIVYIEELPPPA